MGTIDSLDWKLTCPLCGAAEKVWATQRGSSFNIGPWSDIRGADRFEVVSKPGIDGPDLDSATCKKCKVSASVE